MTVLLSLPSRIVAMVLAVITLLVVLQNVDTIAVHLNMLHIQVSSPGYCLYNGEVFDRLSSGKRWFLVSSENWESFTNITVVADFDATSRIHFTKELAGGPDGQCTFTGNDGAATRGQVFTPAATRLVLLASAHQPHSPDCGNPLHVSYGTADCRFRLQVERKPNYWTESAVQTSGWVSRSSFLSRHASLRVMLASLFGLGLPVGLTFLMGSIGAIFVSRLARGESLEAAERVGSIVLLVMVTVVLTTVFGLLTGGIEVAFSSIDANRFLMYDNMIGRIVQTAVGFWGVMLIVGLLPMAAALFYLSKE